MSTPGYLQRFVTDLPADPDPSPRVRQVLRAAYSRVRPTPVSSTTLLAHAPEVAALLGFDADFIRSPTFAQVMGGNALLDGMDPYAAVYGGHQFGNWAGQLGDGRAITLGERVGPDGRVWELQLKGAGPTPYSRGADGRAVLRSSVREFLCSEAMFHLGVPTTRALSLVATGDAVVRDMFYDGNARPEPGAVVCRVAPSFLRLGSFQIHAFRRDHDLLSRLLDHTVRTHFPDLRAETPRETALALLAEVARRTGEMIAQWTRVGFVHGVMNTDNLSVLGLTIDYGPYGWVDDYNPDWTPNTTDAGGKRYRFGHQYAVAGWNLARFAESLYPLVEDVPALEAALGAYEAAHTAAHRACVAGKLGLDTFQPGPDDQLWTDLLALMRLRETDMTLVFRALSAEGPITVDHLTHALYQADPWRRDERAAWEAWLLRWAERTQHTPHRVRKMRAHNPRYVLRNYLCQEVIDQAEQGDPSGISALLDVMRRPYDDQPGRERYAQRRPEWARNRAGCSMLSCSS